MNSIKNTLIVIILLLLGIAANAQTANNLPADQNTTLTAETNEMNNDQEIAKLPVLSIEIKTQEVETVAFYFNYKLLMKQVVRKSALC